MPKGYQAREGYELWHPNREKAEAKTTKAIVAFVLIASAVLLVIITLGGWERLQSTTVGLMTIGWALLYVLFAFLVMRWNRGVLPVAAALAVLMIIFAAVAAGGWFARDKPGLDSPALPEDLLGLLTLIVLTAGPARMADNFKVELPHPRTLDMKTNEKFGEYTRRIYRLLGME